MLLTIKDRFTLLGLLPTEGNLLTMKLMQGLHNVLGFDEAEQLRCSMTTKGDHTTWDPNVAPQDLEIGELSHNVIRDALKKLDDEKKLTVEHVSLYERFVDTPRPKKD